jgi:polar amino acid transport system permease protein
MLQLFVVMYAPGILLDIPMRSRMTAALIAFVINYAAYFSEIFRGGIDSISKRKKFSATTVRFTASALGR